MEYDVVIVGGSFSGLSCTYFLAKKRLKVCLLERGKIGKSTKSTRILTKSVIDDLNVPDNLIKTDIYGFFVFHQKLLLKLYHYVSIVLPKKVLGCTKNNGKKNLVICYRKRL